MSGIMGGLEAHGPGMDITGNKWTRQQKEKFALPNHGLAHRLAQVHVSILEIVGIVLRHGTDGSSGGDV